jgi:hypothetical protein
MITTSRGAGDVMEEGVGLGIFNAPRFEKSIEPAVVSSV